MRYVNFVVRLIVMYGVLVPFCVIMGSIAFLGLFLFDYEAAKEAIIVFLPDECNWRFVSEVLDDT
ncbi:MAG: hypothetical protein DRH97_02055 [Chloroflexi bacterium]|nr:MAG: hypothetical protein DRH97_02055 [Chloroflexota bacterium]